MEPTVSIKRWDAAVERKCQYCHRYRIVNSSSSYITVRKIYEGRYMKKQLARNPLESFYIDCWARGIRFYRDSVTFAFINIQKAQTS